jgi:hypothetical protein
MGNVLTCHCGSGKDALSEVVIQDPADHISDMEKQWMTILANPKQLIDVAASKRSPFKFERVDTKGSVQVNIGTTAVALPDADTSFGKKFASMVDTVQDLCVKYLPEVCRRQTVPHMSIGSIILDRPSPSAFNEVVKKRTGLLAQVKAELDTSKPAPRAKIQTLKINPDGSVTFQLEQDPQQDVVISAIELEAALRKVPTCVDENVMTAELGKFKKNPDGSYNVSRLQQIRLALGGLGCDIKGMFPAGHMVVVNLVDTEKIKQVPKETLAELWGKCHKAWAPLAGEWFELSKIVCLCYVERSLNAGNCVLAPAPGSQPVAFPEHNTTAQALLHGLFTAEPNGDVLIDVDCFADRLADRGTTQWQTLRGELNELAANQFECICTKSVFDVFDSNGSGEIEVSELKHVMKQLGEHLMDEELTAMLKAADYDGCKGVTYSELVKIMNQRHC